MKGWAGFILREFEINHKNFFKNEIEKPLLVI